MAEPRTELAQQLRQDAFEPEQVERVWRTVAAARERKAQGGVGRARVLGIAGAALVTCLGVVLLARTWTTAPAQRALALVRADGTAVGAMEAPASAVLGVPLSDGSLVEVLPGGRMEPLQLSGSAAVWHLQRGKARFSVRPNGPRRWVVEAGAASVEVVGTRFEVAREDGGTRVRVYHGKVLVRGASLPDGVTRLVAGESVFVTALAAPSSAASAASAASGAPGPAPAAAASQDQVLAPALPPGELPRSAIAGRRDADPQLNRGTRDAARAAGKAEPAAAGRPTANARTPTPPAPPQPFDVEALLLAADEARMDRDPARALSALGRIVRELPDDPRAALSAFTIGRIYDEELGDPRGAAAAYVQALALHIRGALAEDTRARLAQAYVDAGEPAQARRAAEAYLARHPTGRHAAAMRELARAAEVVRPGGTE